MPAIHGRKIINNGKPQARTWNPFIGTHATTKHGGTLIGGNPLAIVINGHEDGAPLAKD